MKGHEQNFQDAKKAIRELNGDTSVPAEATLESLEQLRDDLDSYIEELKETMG